MSPPNSTDNTDKTENTDNTTILHEFWFRCRCWEHCLCDVIVAVIVNVLFWFRCRCWVHCRCDVIVAVIVNVLIYVSTKQRIMHAHAESSRTGVVSKESCTQMSATMQVIEVVPALLYTLQGNLKLCTWHISKWALLSLSSGSAVGAGCIVAVMSLLL